jgi:hypothetical protein
VIDGGALDSLQGVLRQTENPLFFETLCASSLVMAFANEALGCGFLPEVGGFHFKANTGAHYLVFACLGHPPVIPFGNTVALKGLLEGRRCPTDRNELVSFVIVDLLLKRGQEVARYSKLDVQLSLIEKWLKTFCDTTPWHMKCLNVLVIEPSREQVEWFETTTNQKGKNGDYRIQKWVYPNCGRDVGVNYLGG